MWLWLMCPFHVDFFDEKQFNKKDNIQLIGKLLLEYMFKGLFYPIVYHLWKGNLLILRSFFFQKRKKKKQCIVT